METLKRPRSISFFTMVIISIFVLFSLDSVLASGVHKGARPKIAPINTKPGGQTYGRWAAEWWQWALGVPGPSNPLVDTTGDDCDQRQVSDVWFLAGSFGSDPIERTCTIPVGKALFFPLINNGFFAFLSDPLEQRTEDFVREQAKCEFPVDLFVEIDGVKVRRRLNRFFTGQTGSQSPLFNVQLPPENVFGAGPGDIPELVLSPSAEEGYYLFIKPLRPGNHTLHWLATGCSDPGKIQDITYFLKISDDS